MLATLYTRRWLPAFLAATLLLGVSAPLVRHACAMVAQQPCSNEHTAPAPPAHHDAAAMPCHQTTPPAPTSAEDCCTVEAPQGVLAKVDTPKTTPKQVLTALPVLLDERPGVAASPVSSPLFSADNGPPTAAVSLHLLHAVLLN